MTDLRDRADIKIFITAFYERVRTDSMLGGIFHARIADEEWPAHLEKITDFWNGILFLANDYKGHPFAAHRDMPVQTEHFDRWVGLFAATVHAHFEGPKANEAINRAQMIATMFDHKIQAIRQQESERRAGFFD